MARGLVGSVGLPAAPDDVEPGGLRAAAYVNPSRPSSSPPAPPVPPTPGGTPSPPLPPLPPLPISPARRRTRRGRRRRRCRTTIRRPRRRMSSSSQQGLTTPANPNPRPGPCRHHPAKRCSAPPVRAPHDPTPPAQPPTTQQPQPSMQLTRPHHGPNYGARSSAIQQHQNHTIRTALAPRNGPHDAHDGHLNYPRLCS